VSEEMYEKMYEGGIKARLLDLKLKLEGLMKCIDMAINLMPDIPNELIRMIRSYCEGLSSYVHSYSASYIVKMLEEYARWLAERRIAKRWP